MNIMFVTHYPEMYGANQSMFNLAKQLCDDYNCKIVILCQSQYNCDFEEYAKNIANCKVYFIRFYNTTFKPNRIIPMIRANVASLVNEYEIKQIRTIIEENKIDLIHTNSFSTLVGAQIAEKYNIPHIWHIREFLEEDYGCSQIRNMIFRRAIKYTKKFIAISNAIKNKYDRAIRGATIDVVYNGLPLLPYSRSLKKDNNIIFAISGVIREEKGILEAIKAFININDSMVDHCELWVIGGGIENVNDPYVRQILDTVNKSDEIYKERIKFLGYRKDILSLLESVDVGLVCSKQEAFGRITIEYMMKGVFVIGANTGGTAELIKDGETGLLYQQGDYLALCKRMIDYIMKKDQYRIVISQARNYSEQFTIKECARKVYKHYMEVLERAPGNT